MRTRDAPATHPRCTRDAPAMHPRCTRCTFSTTAPSNRPSPLLSSRFPLFVSPLRFPPPPFISPNNFPVRFPYIILNAFGVLKFKSMSEDLLKSSGLPFTILRPGRLTDGPYTSYDLNTLLKATSGTRRAVQITTGDSLTPEATSRLVVAEACLQALGSGATAGRDFDLGSTEGEGPGSDAEQWAKLFASAKPKGAPATTAGASR